MSQQEYKNKIPNNVEYHLEILYKIFDMNSGTQERIKVSVGECPANETHKFKPLALKESSGFALSFPSRKAGLVRIFVLFCFSPFLFQ